MGERRLMHQMSAPGQILADHRVGLPDEEAGIGSGLFGEDSAAVHRREDLKVVAQAGQVVFPTVAGSGMHAAGAGVEGDIIGQDDQRLPVQKGMAAMFPFQEPGRKGGQNPVIFQAEDLKGLLDQFFSHDPDLVAGLDRGVGEIRMQGHGQVGRQGPGSGGPDHHRHLFIGQRGNNRAEIVGQRKFYIDRSGGVVLILHLGLSQGGMTGGAPVHRLLAAGHRPGDQKVVELPGDRRLIGIVDGQIGLLPVAQDTQAAKLGALDVDPLPGILAAGLAKSELVNLLLFRPQLLVDIEFDRQPMAVPARHERAVMAVHPLGPQDDVLEDLVQSVAHMKMAVGIGRTVMKNIGGSTAGLRLHLLVEFLVFPLLQHFRLALGQTGLHLELGLGQIERRPVIHEISPAILKPNGFKDQAGTVAPPRSGRSEHPGRKRPAKIPAEPQVARLKLRNFTAFCGITPIDIVLRLAYIHFSINRRYRSREKSFFNHGARKVQRKISFNISNLTQRSPQPLR